MKTPEDSRSHQEHIVMYQDLNGAGRLFGGRLLEWIDEAAGVAARRHAGMNVTTAAIDHLQFLAPASVNDTVVLKGRVTWTGRTSMEVRVETFVEPARGKRTLVNRAYLVMVGLDENQAPAQIPPIACETEEDKTEYAAACERRAQRLRAQA